MKPADSPTAGPYGPLNLDLRRYLVTVLSTAGILHRVVVTAAAVLHVQHGEGREGSPVDVDAIVGLTKLDAELVTGALDAAVAEGLVERVAGGAVVPVQEAAVPLDPAVQERWAIGLTQDCDTCGSAAGTPCTTNRGRPSGHHQPRRSFAARTWNRHHQQEPAA